MLTCDQVITPLPAPYCYALVDELVVALKDVAWLGDVASLPFGAARVDELKTRCFDASVYSAFWKFYAQLCKGTNAVYFLASNLF